MPQWAHQDLPEDLGVDPAFTGMPHSAATIHCNFLTVARAIMVKAINLMVSAALMD